MNSSGRLKVLVVAYACNPKKSSEPGIGWNFVKRLTENCELTVLTRRKHRGDIEDFLGRCGDETLRGIRWVYYDLPPWALKFKRQIGQQFYFKLWQIFAHRRLHTWIMEEQFDVVNHNTLGVAWSASPFYDVPCPFVWGPIGGGDTIPWAFLREEAPASIVRELVYKIVIWYATRISLSHRRCRENSAAVVYRTRQVMRHYMVTPASLNVFQIGETGCEPRGESSIDLSSGEIRAIAVSRLDYWKGIIYAVKGFEQFLANGGKGQLTVLGNGGEYVRIHEYVQRKRLGDSIRLLGNVSLEEFKNQMNRANVLIYPSFRDGGSFVVLEAMTLGMPIIVGDFSGPAEMVGAGGLIASAKTPAEFIAEIANDLTKLQTDLALAREKGALLRARSLDCYTWEKHADALFEVFLHVVRQPGQRS